MAVKAAKLDHYKVLGLPSGEERKKLTIDDIKKAYKRKALQLHPDKRPADPHANAKFQSFQSSYQFLLSHFTRKEFYPYFSDQCQSSATASKSKQSKRQRRDPDPEPEPYREPDLDSDPEAEERRRNAWREFLKTQPSRIRDLHIRRTFSRKFF